MKIKTGDTVRIMVGKDKGKEGKVMQTFPDQGLVVVEGVRSSTRHLSAKKTRGADGKKAEGQKVTFNAPLRVDNVAIVSGKTVGRVGYQVTAGGQKTRVLRVKKTVKEIG